MKEGEGMILDSKLDTPEIHDLIHLVADIHKRLAEVEKILDKIVGDK